MPGKILSSRTGDNTPEQFSGFVKQELAKWAKVVRDLGLKAN